MQDPVSSVWRRRPHLTSALSRIKWDMAPSYRTDRNNSLFRSRDWLSANQGPVFPDSVGYPIFNELYNYCNILSAVYWIYINNRDERPKPDPRVNLSSLVGNET
eukprot:sb/3478032/